MGPHVSLVAIASCPDLGRLVFATRRDSTKYSNLCHHPQVALLLDSRTNTASDVVEAEALTVLGRAIETPAGEHAELEAMYVQQHPELAAFPKDPESALVTVRVHRYLLVSHFDEKAELDLRGDGGFQGTLARDR